MTTFPLYDNIENKLPKWIDDLSFEQKDFVISHIEHLSQTQFELIYALIRCYQVNNDEPEACIIPYGGKKLKKGIKFDFEKLPTRLQHILHSFLKLHIDSLNERVIAGEVTKHS